MDVSNLQSRVAGESLMVALRSSMSPELPANRLHRIFGRNPIPAQSRSWYVGILGEQMVARQLRTLPEDWLVLHSVPVGTKGSDIDHVVVSPSGRVLTLNTKHSPGGKVWVSPKSILVNGQRRTYLRNSQHEASRAARLVAAATGGHVDTLAVIVVVGASLTHKGEPDNVAVVTVKQLVHFLTSRLAQARSDVAAETIRCAVSQPQTWVTKPEPGGTSVDLNLWFLDLKSRARLARRRRRQWIVGAFAIATGGTFSLGALGFDSLKSLF
jgi:hypothetical protein